MCVEDPMHLLLCSIRTFHFEMLGETNSSTLFISRTRSKFCNSQIKRLHQLLFYSSFEYHTFIYQEVVLNSMALSMKWCSYTSSLTFTSKLHAWGCWVNADVCILFRAIHVAFKILGTSVSFLALLVPRSLLEVDHITKFVHSGAYSWSKS